MTWDHNKLWGGHPAVTTGDDRTRGQRAADIMKRMLACWPALGIILIVIGSWMVYNSHYSGRHSFDPYPWILLNLCLSCFAALQCFILLIANKRGEQIAAEIAQHTYENTEAQKAMLDTNTELTRAVHDLTEAVHAHIFGEPEAQS